MLATVAIPNTVAYTDISSSYSCFRWGQEYTCLDDLWEADPYVIQQADDTQICQISLENLFGQIEEKDSLNCKPTCSSEVMLWEPLEFFEPGLFDTSSTLVDYSTAYPYIAMLQNPPFCLLDVANLKGPLVFKQNVYWLSEKILQFWEDALQVAFFKQDFRLLEKFEMAVLCASENCHEDFLRDIEDALFSAEEALSDSSSLLNFFEPALFRKRISSMKVHDPLVLFEPQLFDLQSQISTEEAMLSVTRKKSMEAAVVDVADKAVDVAKAGKSKRSKLSKIVTSLKNRGKKIIAAIKGASKGQQRKPSTHGKVDFYEAYYFYRHSV